MSSRVCVDLVACSRGKIVGGLEQASSARDGLSVRHGRMLDMEIEVDLLGVPVGPIGWDVIGRVLHSDDPPILGVEDTLELIVAENPASEHPRPEPAFGREVSCIEHDDLTDDLHPVIFSHVSPMCDENSRPPLHEDLVTPPHRVDPGDVHSRRAYGPGDSSRGWGSLDANSRAMPCSPSPRAAPFQVLTWRCGGGGR